MPKFEYLPQWSIESVEQSDDGYIAAATYATAAEICSKCGSAGTLGRHGSKHTSFRDAPIRGRRATIVVQRQRYRCKSCGGTSLQPLPDIDERHRMLRRCIDHVRYQSVRQPFARIARDIGVDEKTIRLIASEHMSELQRSALLNPPRRLGISELTVLGKPRLLLGDIDAGNLIDLLETRGARSVVSWLARSPARQDIRVISIEMRRPYREAIRSALPRATIVVNKLRILSLADQSFDAVSRRLATSLERKEQLKLAFNWHLMMKRSCELGPVARLNLRALLARHPILNAAYDAKEQFHELCSLDSKAKAKDAYAVWRKHLPDELRKSFQPLLAAMQIWQSEILESWDHPTKEDFSEFAAKSLRIINRLGRGYSFPILRTRLLFGSPFSGPTFTCKGCLGEYPIELRSVIRRAAGPWCANCHRLHADEWFTRGA